MKRAELNLYKKHSPDELEKLYNDFEELQENIRIFINTYHYNYIKKCWKKIKEEE